MLHFDQPVATLLFLMVMLTGAAGMLWAVLEISLVIRDGYVPHAKVPTLAPALRQSLQTGFACGLGLSGLALVAFCAVMLGDRPWRAALLGGLSLLFVLAALAVGVPRARPWAMRGAGYLLVAYAVVAAALLVGRALR